MAQDRLSLATQEEVVAMELRDKYSDYYRNLQTSLTAKKIVPPSTVSTPVLPPTAQPVMNTKTPVTVNYGNIIPGKTLTVNYSLGELNDGALQNVSPVVLLGGLALAAYVLSRK
jgi:hypothetical protein